MELSVGDFKLVLELRAGEDYSESWKKDLKPIAINKDFIIAPSWWTEPLAADKNAKVLRLDPGSAFGSGHHPTTYMCLKALSDLSLEANHPASILDLGAGSAVLALASALMFPQGRFAAIDNDPETSFAAKSNLALNNLADKIEHQIASIEEIDGPFDLIVANLTRNTLVALAKQMALKTKTPGKLILSGLIEEQVADVVKAFGALGFHPVRHLSMAEWSALLLSNAAHAGSKPVKELVEEPRWEDDQDPAQDEPNGDASGADDTGDAGDTGRRDALKSKSLSSSSEPGQ
jgi:ribosomal protein L11 methyltransferase